MATVEGRFSLQNIVKKEIDGSKCADENNPLLKYSYKGVCKQDLYQVKDPPFARSSSNSSLRQLIPTQVYFEVVDMQVLDINEEENKIEINMKYYHVWKDHRITVNPSDAGKISRHGAFGIAVNWFDKKDGKRPPIWYPDGIKMTNIIHRKQLHEPFTTLIFAKWIEPPLWPATEANEATIVLETDLRISLFCDFNLVMFPLDTQYCYLMESNEEDDGLKLLVSPRASTGDVKTMIKDGFNCTSTMQDYIVKNHTFVGFKIKMQRIISPYVFQYYIPSAAIVFVAQISFIIPPSSIPGRTGLLATLFLTLSTLFINHMVKFFDFQ